MPAHILVVDYNPYNLELLCALLKEQGYDPLGVTTLEEFDRVLDSRKTINLALVDIDGFDQTIWDRCERLRLRKVPLLVIATGESLESRREILRQSGVHGLFRKPMLTAELVAAIGSLLGAKV